MAPATRSAAGTSRALSHGLAALLLSLLALAATACASEVEREIARARQLQRHGAHRGALTVLRSTLRKHSGHAGAALELGHFLQAGQRFAEAEQAYEVARRATAESGDEKAARSDTVAARATRAQARLLAHTGRPSQARRILRAHLAEHSEDADSWLALAALHLHGNDPTRAREALAQAQAARPTSRAALYMQGRVALATGDLDEAGRRFERLSGLAPRTPYGHYGLAITAIRRGHTARACEALASARIHGLDDASAIDHDEAIESLPACVGGNQAEGRGGGGG